MLRLHALILIGAVVACVAAICAWGYARRWHRFPRSPKSAGWPAPVNSAVRRHFLARYLEVYPDNMRARLLMAELTTEPTNAQPVLALEQLARIRPQTHKEAALIKFFEGKARFQEQRYDLAEACWTEALRLDAIVPEAGWALVDLLDKEGRTAEAHSLGMRMHEVEPDPADRVKILLEMMRLDVEFPDPLSQLELFEPIARDHPEHQPISLVVGLARVRCNRSDEGLKVLRGQLDRQPGSAEAWDAWLTGLYDASEGDLLERELARLPKDLADDGRFAKHKGMVAQFRRDWPKAVAEYRRAFMREPFNWAICYRLRFALRQVGDTAEFKRVNELYESYKAAYKEVRGSYFDRFEPGTKPTSPDASADHQHGAYYETLAIKTLGLRPYPALYQRLAGLREQMGRFDECGRGIG